MKLLAAIQNILPETKKQYRKMHSDSHLTLLYSNPETVEEVVYRRNGKSVDKIIEIDVETGSKVKTTHFDYFDDKKVRSVDEYDYVTGKKIRTINYVLYKSVDEYDIETGKKVRTINYNVKDESKISSIQEYDINTGKIVNVSIYKRDGKTVSIIKKIDLESGKVTSWVNNNKYKPIEIENYTTRIYDNIEFSDKKNKDDIDKLIDNLYKNNLKFETMCS